MIDELLADALENANRLRVFGAAPQADALGALIAALKADPGFRAHLTWLTEAEAETLSGHAGDWFRVRWAYFAKLDLARKQGRVRQYRETLVRAVYLKAALEAAHEEGVATARKEAA